MVDGAQKLKLVRELGIIRRSMSATRGVNKLTLIKRVKEIRLLLSVKVEETAKLVIDTTNKAASLQSIVEYAKNGIKDLPEPLRASEAATVRRVLALVSQLPGDNLVADDAFGTHNALSDFERGEDKVKVLEYFKELGSAFNSDTEKVKSVVGLIKELRATAPQDSPEIAEKIAEVQQAFDEIRKKLYDLTAINSFNGYDQESIDKAAVEYGAMRDKYNETWSRIHELGNQKYTDHKAKIDELKAHITPIGETVISTLLDSSPITKEQADNWANSQFIDKSIAARLKKQGYPVEDIRRDMSEFYRITRGKLRSIDMSATGAKRAHASGIGHFENNYITPGSNFNKTTLWHELAHHLEADPAARDAANGFLLKRRESEKVYSLRSLTGNMGYRKDEGAYKDEFIDPYVGKVYDSGYTDVFSMGLQYLEKPDNAAIVLGRDHEMAAMIIGYIQADLSPAMKALQSIQDHAKGVSQDYREEVKNEYQQAVARLAATVNIEDDHWFESLDEVDRDFLLKYGLNRAGNVKFIGSWGFIRVFSGKFKSRKTKRISNGYAAFYHDKLTFKTDRGMSSPAVAFIHEDMETMKAGLKIALEEFGGDVYRISWSLFGYSDTQNRILSYAKQILGVTQ